MRKVQDGESKGRCRIEKRGKFRTERVEKV